MNKELTYEELIQFALENYSKGGDGVYECWDRQTFDEYVAEFGPITKKSALKMFKLNLEIWNEYQATIW
jgi:hypothetical protein